MSLLQELQWQPNEKIGAMDTQCNSQTQQWQPQGMFLYHMGDKDWQTGHAEIKAHMQHRHNLRGVLIRADQKGTGVI